MSGGKSARNEQADENGVTTLNSSRRSLALHELVRLDNLRSSRARSDASPDGENAASSPRILTRNRA